MKQESPTKSSNTGAQIARKCSVALVAAFALLASLAAPAGAQAETNAEGWIADEVGVGFFYGTFNDGPNTALFAGGSVEEFCVAGPNGNPGSAASRVFLRSDGSVDIKTNEKGVPIYLYSTNTADIPSWLDSVCPGILAGDSAPDAFAVGTADLKIRLSVISPTEIQIFNGVNGKAIAGDGTEYSVKGSADFTLIDGAPSESPPDFVDFSLQEIRRGG